MGVWSGVKGIFLKKILHNYLFVISWSILHYPSFIPVFLGIPLSKSQEVFLSLWIMVAYVHYILNWQLFSVPFFAVLQFYYNLMLLYFPKLLDDYTWGMKNYPSFIPVSMRWIIPQSQEVQHIIQVTGRISKFFNNGVVCALYFEFLTILRAFFSVLQFCQDFMLLHFAKLGHNMLDDYTWVSGGMAHYPSFICCT